MDSSECFEVQLSRIRTGEIDAVREFVADYEPFIRRSIRRRLKRSSLLAVTGSADICQSALGSFLIRAIAGEYQLTRREDLEKLLLTIARRKLATVMRREFAARRDRRRLEVRDLNNAMRSRIKDNPSRQVDALDLLDHVQRALTEAERMLFVRRRCGNDWKTIAQELGESADVLRQRLSRGLRRVAIELNLEATDE